MTAASTPETPSALAGQVREVAGEERDRHLERRVVDPAPDLADHVADREPDRDAADDVPDEAHGRLPERERRRSRGDHRELDRGRAPSPSLTRLSPSIDRDRPPRDAEPARDRGRRERDRSARRPRRARRRPARRARRSRACATTATPTIVAATRPIASSEIGRRFGRSSRSDGEERRRVEQRRQEARSARARAAARGPGTPGDEAEREPAEDEQDRIRDSEERIGEQQERGHRRRAARSAATAPVSAELHAADDSIASRMCGICGIARRNGARRTRAARGDERRRSCTAGRTRTAVHLDGGSRPRGAAALDHRPRRPATSRSRTRTARVARRPERRDLQLPRAARRARARGPPLPHARRHRGARRTSTRSGATRSRSGCAACSPSRSGTRARRRLVLARDRVRDQAALLPRRRRRLAFASELRALPRGEIDLDALEAFLAFNSIPAPLTIFRESRKLPPGTCSSGTTARRAPSASRALRRFPPARCATTTRPSSSRSCARGCATPCARTSSATCRSASCSPAASTRACSPRSPPRRAREPLRTFSIGFEERSFDELGDARLVAERYGDRPPRARAAARRGAAAARARRGVRRAVRRLVGAADVPRLASSRREDVKVALSGEGGDELFGGYYTYAADLLAHRFGRAARLAAPLVERLPTSTREGELRLQGEALRARGAPAAARAAPRLEGDLLGRRCARS